MILKVQEDNECIVIMSGHQIEELKDFCDITFKIANGKFMQIRKEVTKNTFNAVRLRLKNMNFIKKYLIENNVFFKVTSLETIYVYCSDIVKIKQMLSYIILNDEFFYEFKLLQDGEVIE